jgi:hypothetical protein
MKAQLGEDRFNREIGCEFIIADETLIKPNTLLMLEGIRPVSRMDRFAGTRSEGKYLHCIIRSGLGTGS